MDLTRLLPYEILQHVASWLLPRYQCMLALTSRHNYHYLYNDLLRWHAKWTLIKPIKYHVLNDEMSLREYNKKVICTTIKQLEHVYPGPKMHLLVMHNLTNYAYIYINDSARSIKIEQINKGRVYRIQCLPLIHPIGAFDGFYKYMHGDVFEAFASVRMSPLLSLPYKILTHIKYQLPHEIRLSLREEIHPHLTYV